MVLGAPARLAGPRASRAGAAATLLVALGLGRAARAAIVPSRDVQFQFEPAPPGACDAGWVFVRDPAFPSHAGSCYRMLNFLGSSRAARTQNESQTLCAALSDDPLSVASPQVASLASARSLNELALLWLLCPSQCHIGLQFADPSGFLVSVDPSTGARAWLTFDPVSQTYVPGQPSDRFQWTDGTDLDANYTADFAAEATEPFSGAPFVAQMIGGAFSPFFAPNRVVESLATDPEYDLDWQALPAPVFLQNNLPVPATFPSVLRSYFSSSYTGSGWASWPPVAGWTSWTDLATTLALDSSTRTLVEFGLTGAGAGLTRPQAICEKPARTDHPCFSYPCPAYTMCIPVPDASRSTAYSCVCPAGQYDDSAAQVCRLCNSTSIMPVPGQPACSPCSDGYVADAARLECVKCPAGTYRSGSTTSCQTCVDNTYSPEEGSAECQACGPGLVVADPALPTSCIDENECLRSEPVCVSEAVCENRDVRQGVPFRCRCPEGQRGDGRVDGTQCHPCEGRFVATEIGAASCTACELGTVPNAIHSACDECGAGTFADSSNMGPNCTPCDQGLDSSADRSVCNVNVNECQEETSTCSPFAACQDKHPLIDQIPFSCECLDGYGDTSGGAGLACRALPWASFRGSAGPFYAIDGSIAVSPDLIIDIYHPDPSIRPQDLRVSVTSADLEAPMIRVFPVPTTGERAANRMVTSVQLQLLAPINYEMDAGGPFAFVVSITDGSSELVADRGDPRPSNPFELAFSITAVDANDAPIILGISPPEGLSVDENAAAYTEAGQIFGFDEDGHDLTYRIAGGDGASVFDIDPATGVVFVREGATLNFEEKSQFLIDVVVDDGTEYYDRVPAEDADTRRVSARGSPTRTIEMSARHALRVERFERSSERIIARGAQRGQRRRLLETRQTFVVSVRNVREPPRILTSAEDLLEVSKAAPQGEVVTGGRLVGFDEDSASSGDVLYWRVLGGSSGWQAFDFGVNTVANGYLSSALLLAHPEALDETAGEMVVEVIVEVRDRLRVSDPEAQFATQTFKVAVRCLPSSCDSRTQVPIGSCSRSAPRACALRLHDDNQNAATNASVLWGYPRESGVNTNAIPGKVYFEVLAPEGMGGRIARQPDCTTHVHLDFNTMAPYAPIREPSIAVRILERTSGRRITLALAQGEETRVSLGILNYGLDESVQLEVYVPHVRAWVLVGSPIAVPTRCFCTPCALLGTLAESRRNPVCREDSVEAFSLPSSDWCVPCRQCPSGQWQTVACEEGSPFQDRECESCRTCSADEYMVSDCAPESDRVCAPKLLPGWPQRNDDGTTGPEGLLISLYGARRDRNCDVVVGFRLSDSGVPEGSEVWFKIEDEASSFAWVFLAFNHHEYRFDLGHTGWGEEVRLVLSRFEGSAVANQRPEVRDSAWMPLDAQRVNIGPLCVAWFPSAEVLPGWPMRSTRFTGVRGSMELIYGDGRRLSNCHAVVSVRYVAPGGPSGATFLIVTDDETNGWRVELSNGEEAWVDLGSLSEVASDANGGAVRLTLLAEGNAGEWVRGSSVVVTTACDVTFPLAPILPGWPVRSTVRTGLSGALELVGNGMRTSECEVVARVRYVTDDGPSDRTFALRISERDLARGSATPFRLLQVTLARNTEAIVLLGGLEDIPRSENIVVELLFQDTRGSWRPGDSFMAPVQCEAPLLPAPEVPGSRQLARVTTGHLGAFLPLFENGLRDAQCEARFRITYNDPEECAPTATRSFVVVETRADSGETAAWSVQLQSGSEVEVSFEHPVRANSSAPRRIDRVTQYSLERVDDTSGTRTVVGSFAVTDLCVSDVPLVSFVSSTQQRFDLETGPSGRIDALFAGQRAPRDDTLRIARCDPVVRVAYAHSRGLESRLFLLGDSVPRVRFVISNFVQAWINLRGRISAPVNSTLGLNLWQRVTAGSWQQVSPGVVLHPGCFSELPLLEWDTGFPRENLAPTPVSGAITVLSAPADRVVFLVNWCNADNPATTDFAVQFVSPASGTSATFRVRLSNCFEARSSAPFPSDGAPSFEVRLLRSGEAGVWLDEGARTVAVRA